MPEESVIEYEDFAKLDIRIGVVERAERVEGTEKLLKLVIDLGAQLGKRQVVAGVGKRYSPEELVGKKVVVLTNLKPKKIRGVVSQGMILAAGCGEGEEPSLLVPDKEVQPGSKVC